MTTTITTVDGVNIDVAAIPLATILTDMVEASGKVYGSYIRIAAKFNDLMPFAWYDMAPTEKSDDAKAYKAHKTALYDALKLAGHSNPSVPGKRIADYGRNIRNGLSPNGKTTLDGQPVNGEGDGEGDGAGPAPRSPLLRNIEELTTLYKFNDKLGKDAPAKVAAAQKHIIAALKVLGLDVATIA